VGGSIPSLGTAKAPRSSLKLLGAFSIRARSGEPPYNSLPPRSRGQRLMQRKSSSLRIGLATTALFGLSCLLAWQHRDTDEGLRAEDVPETRIQDELEIGQDGRQLLLDLVEPEDGEGGSGAELAALIASLGLHAEPAGFYSETEHLWRVHGTPAQLEALERELAGHPLVEGIEADGTYSLPREAMRAAEPGEELDV